MIWVRLTAALFFALLLFPILWGAFWYYRGKNSVLQVRQDRKRDPRYFAKSFDALFEKAWMQRWGETIIMSRPEHYILADEAQPEAYAGICEKMVVTEHLDFHPPFGSVFQREIHAGRNVWFPENARLRAVYAKGSMILERGTRVERWADAEGTVAVYDQCDLGISLTSATAISIGKECTFRRIYAPVIHVGSYPGQPQKPAYQRDGRIYHVESVEEKRDGKRRVSMADADEQGVAHTSFVGSSRVVVDEDVVIQGSVRARKDVRLADRAVVCGNIFANSDVYLGRNSTVLGNVFSQGDVYCEPGVVIGREGHISSVIARGKIVLEQDCFIYGYVSNEMGGVCCPVNRKDRTFQERYLDRAEYLIWPEPESVLTFASREDFEAVDSQGFRHNWSLRQVVIPEGVRKIPDSMFFDCQGLERVELPASLEEIGEFAFADCVQLSGVKLGALERLRILGRSAFDGCQSIEEICLPPSLERLGPAVFCNCTSLRRVVRSGGPLREIGSHCFQNCPLIKPFDMGGAEVLEPAGQEKEVLTGV